MNRPRARRGPALSAAVLALVLLGGCGQQAEEDRAGGAQTTPDAVPASRSEPTNGSCSAPPPLPSDIPTFEPAQAPTGASAEVLTAAIETTCGAVEAELYGDRAPVTVGSFELLAEQGYWEDSPCHRLTTQGIHVLQCGDPTGSGRGGPGYTFGIENAPPDGRYPRGTLAMARTTDPDSNGGQFFIVHQDTQLPVDGGGYSVFGRVTEGMDIIDRIATQGVDGGGADGLPAQPISIRTVAVTGE